MAHGPGRAGDVNPAQPSRVAICTCICTLTRGSCIESRDPLTTTYQARHTRTGLASTPGESCDGGIRTVRVPAGVHFHSLSLLQAVRAEIHPLPSHQAASWGCTVLYRATGPYWAPGPYRLHGTSQETRQRDYGVITTPTGRVYTEKTGRGRRQAQQQAPVRDPPQGQEEYQKTKQGKAPEPQKEKSPRDRRTTVRFPPTQPIPRAQP